MFVLETKVWWLHCYSGSHRVVIVQYSDCWNRRFALYQKKLNNIFSPFYCKLEVIHLTSWFRKRYVMKDNLPTSCQAAVMWLLQKLKTTYKSVFGHLIKLKKIDKNNKHTGFVLTSYMITHRLFLHPYTHHFKNMQHQQCFLMW